MRLNGTLKIITLDDILINSGENLSLLDVLDEHTEDIGKLKSNVKWLYKYGGNGSGVGGGSSSNVEFSINAMLDNKSFSQGEEINFASTGVYDLYIKIKNPDPNVPNYYLTYTYNNVNAEDLYTSSKIELNGANGYSTVQHLNLIVNGQLNVIVRDEINDILKSVYCSYVTQPYSISAKLVNDSNESYAGLTTSSNYEIDSTAALLLGINVKLDYTVKINSKYSASYSITAPNSLDNIESTPIESVSQDNDNSSVLIPIPKELLVNEKSGIYIITIQFNINAVDEPIIVTLLYNLIPKDMFLMVQPQTGVMYSTKLTGDDMQMYQRGNITIDVKAYQGSNTNKTFTLITKYDNTVVSRQQLDERVFSSTTIKVDSGEHEVSFELSNNAASSYVLTTKYYIYVKENSLSHLDWYNVQEEDKGRFFTSRYSFGVKDGCTDDLKPIFGNNVQGSPYKSTINDTIKTVTFDNADKLSNDNYHTHISFGIQYSKVNTYDNDILRMSRTGSDGNQFLTLRITLNKISFFDNSTTCNWFLDLEDSMNINDKYKKYHLVDIYSILKEYGSNTWFEISIYVDGVLEAAPTGYVKNALGASKLELLPGNYYINHFESSVFDVTNIEHVDVMSYRYYLNYLNKVKSIDDEIVTQYDSLDKFNNFWLAGIVDSYHNQKGIEDDALETMGLVRIATYDDLINIVNKSDIPSICITMDELFEGDSIWKYLRPSVHTKKSILVGLSYSNINESTNLGNPLSDIVTPTNTHFEIEVQGSSTKDYGTKNFELILKDDQGNEGANSRVVLFSPNFKNDDPNTFLPEKSFTLKADMVDSSHSNNTSIGDFVNDIEVPVRTQIGDNMPYNSHIKNCLKGFPMALYFNVRYNTTGGEKASRYYYGGIYNFNLGRNSANNLGYTDRTNMQGKVSDSWLGENKFSFITLNENNLKKNFITCEVQDKHNYWDFSQYDPSILFPIGGHDEDSDTLHMLGDITTSYDKTTMLVLASKMMKAFSRAGGYLFEQIAQKNFSNSKDDNYGYDLKYQAVDSNGISLNQVPNYRYLFVRTQDGLQFVFTPGEQQPSATRQELIDAIIGDPDLGVTPQLNYQSIVEYYTICMAFLLGDSVEKNTQLKTWNGNTWFAEFYDMDTGLGKDNEGGKTKYFAFSDYWIPYNNSEGITEMKSGIVYRDFYPERTSSNNVPIGFDIPSSYMFAIAKYSKIAGMDVDVFPLQLWSRWRSANKDANDRSKGILLNADLFIDNYWGKGINANLKPLINFNYRTKYLHPLMKFRDENADSHKYDELDYVKFNGTGKAELRNWLSKRFLLLDAYFNISGRPRTINKRVGDTYINTDIQEVYVNPSDNNISSNPDVIVMQSIFAATGNTTLFSSDRFVATVQAPEYSPLVISLDKQSMLYVYGGEGKYKFDVDVSGHISTIIGGSSLWTYLDTLDGFQMLTFYLKSNNLEYIQGSTARISNWDSFSVPSVKELHLNSSNMTGQLTIDGNKYLSLSTLDISHSNITLTVKDCQLSTINLNGIGLNNPTGVNVRVSGCTKLKELVLQKNNQLTHINQLILFDIPNEVADISLYDYDVNNIQISTLDGKGKTLSLSNMNNLKSITISGEGYENISIHDCPLLTTISIPDYKLSNLNISNCNSLTQIGNQANVIDLSRQKEDLNVLIYNCGKISTVKFGKYVKLPTNAFINDVNLKYVDGEKLHIVGHDVFRNCKVFTGRQTNNTVCNFYFDTPDLSNMFMIDNPDGNPIGAINLDTAALILQANKFKDPSTVTNMSYFFSSQPIKYSVNDLVAEYNNGSTKLNMSHFTNLGSVSHMYNLCGFTALSKGMLSYGSNLNTAELDYIIVGYGEVVYITTDLFENIIDRISAIKFAWPGTLGTMLRVCDVYTNDHGDKLSKISTDSWKDGDVIKISRLFNPIINHVVHHPTKLKEISLMHFYYKNIYDFTLLFTNEWTIQKISDFFGNGYFAWSEKYKAAYNEDTRLSSAVGLLIPICKTLTNLVKSFYFDVQGDQELKVLVNYSDVIDYNVVSKLIQVLNQSLLFDKTCTYQEYIKIVDLLTASKTTNTLDSIFSNTYIVCGEKQPEIYFGSDYNYKITNIDRMFYDCHFVESIENTIDLYSSFENKPFLYIPNIASMDSTFHGCHIQSIQMFDLFSKKISTTLSDTNYYARDTDPDGHITTTKLTRNSHIYKQDITSVRAVFETTTFAKTSFEFEKQDDKITFTKPDGSLVDINDVYVVKNGKYVKCEESIEYKEYEEYGHHLLCPPDIFFACKESCDSNYAFHACNLTGEFPNALMDGKPLWKHNTFYNLEINPKYTGIDYSYSYDDDGVQRNITQKIYQVIPDWGIDVSDISNSVMFFRISYPYGANSFSNARVYIMSDKSVNPPSVSLFLALPNLKSGVYSDLKIDANDTYTYNIQKTTFGFMYHKADVYDPELDGIDFDKFSNAYLNNMFDGTIMSLYNTYLFSKDTDLTNFKSFITYDDANRRYTKIFVTKDRIDRMYPSNFIKLPKASTIFNTQILPESYKIYKHLIVDADTSMSKYGNVYVATIDQSFKFYDYQR